MNADRTHLIEVSPAQTVADVKAALEALQGESTLTAEDIGMLLLQGSPNEADAPVFESNFVWARQALRRMSSESCLTESS